MVKQDLDACMWLQARGTRRGRERATRESEEDRETEGETSLCT